MTLSMAPVLNRVLIFSPILLSATIGKTVPEVEPNLFTSYTSIGSGIAVK